MSGKGIPNFGVAETLALFNDRPPARRSHDSRRSRDPGRASVQRHRRGLVEVAVSDPGTGRARGVARGIQRGAAHRRPSQVPSPSA